MSAILRDLNNVPARFSAGLDQDDEAPATASLASRVSACLHGPKGCLSGAVSRLVTLLGRLLVFGKPLLKVAALAVGTAALN